MKIDFSQKIVDLKGIAMKLPTGEEGTLSNVCVEVLLASFPGEENLPKGDKIQRGRLAEKIYEQGIIDIPAEEAVLMQTLIGKAYGPIIVMRADAMLEGIIEK